MTDWVGGTEKLNRNIKKKSLISAKELLWALLFVSISGAIIFCIWVHGEIIDTGYEIQQLSQHEEQLKRTLENLIVREEILQSPERIDRIARGRLGMEPLRPEQILATGITPAPADRSAMAMANRD